MLPVSARAALRFWCYCFAFQYLAALCLTLQQLCLVPPVLCCHQHWTHLQNIAKKVTDSRDFQSSFDEHPLYCNQFSNLYDSDITNKNRTARSLRPKEKDYQNVTAYGWRNVIYNWLKTCWKFLMYILIE